MISSTLTPKRWLGVRGRVQCSLVCSTLSSCFCFIYAIIFAYNSLWVSIDEYINPVLGKGGLSLIWEFVLGVGVVHHKCIVVWILVYYGGTLTLSRNLYSTNGVLPPTLPISFSTSSGSRAYVPLLPIRTPRLDTVRISSKPPIWTVHMYWYALLPPIYICCSSYMAMTTLLILWTEVKPS